MIVVLFDRLVFVREVDVRRDVAPIVRNFPVTVLDGRRSADDLAVVVVVEVCALTVSVTTFLGLPTFLGGPVAFLVAFRVFCVVLAVFVERFLPFSTFSSSS